MPLLQSTRDPIKIKSNLSQKLFHAVNSLVFPLKFSYQYLFLKFRPYYECPSDQFCFIIQYLIDLQVIL